MSEEKPKLGDTAKCKSCGEIIQFNGVHWFHTTTHPRHPATPKPPTAVEKAAAEGYNTIWNDTHKQEKTNAPASGTSEDHPTDPDPDLQC